MGPNRPPDYRTALESHTTFSRLNTHPINRCKLAAKYGADADAAGQHGAAAVGDRQVAGRHEVVAQEQHGVVARHRRGLDRGGQAIAASGVQRKCIFLRQFLKVDTNGNDLSA